MRSWRAAGVSEPVARGAVAPRIGGRMAASPEGSPPSGPVSRSGADHGDSTVVGLMTDYELKYGPIGALMDTLFARRQVRKGMDELLAGLKHHIETGETVNEPAAVSAA